MTLQEILEKVSVTETEDLRLFFITRVLKENVRRNARIIDKYLFRVYQVDIDDEIRQYLYDLSREQLERIIKKDFEIVDYDVVSDDTEHLFTYSMKNKVFSFSDVVYNQLQKNPPKMQSIESILSNDDELWAYCVGFNDLEEKDWIYTFRKISAGKVAIDEKDNHKSMKLIRTFFDTTNQKLELLKGETVNLEKQIDCIYYTDTFYVIKKTNFEQILGLQDEYKEEAKNVVLELKSTGRIDGLEIIEEKIESNPAIHKKLVRISRIGNYRTLNDKVITKMKTVCRKYGVKLNVKDGKLAIEEEKDIDTILKMLADYYKTGEVSGKAYGTFAGKELVNK
uniref:Kiwa anti-phage protein KwaB-like domain-containing protein n=1 Tax=uncultured Dysgonomonas sp. TaxID=206096 RepID=UPI00262CB15A|nr:Kiwa anti-phage protein KwaB-like domain-containing protein [uncultured Dysgonomonas sp.]